MPAAPHVLIVGAGISGAACAGALRRAGCEVTVRDRGRAPGGRLAAPTLHGRRVDLGAAYFTVQDDAFGAVVQRWASGDFARPWTDTFDSYSADGRASKAGPMRWAAPDGLRSLARDLLAGVDVRTGSEVTMLDTSSSTTSGSTATGTDTSGFDAVVLAMPDPQVTRLVPTLNDPVEFDPVIAVAAGWGERCWPIEDAAFVNDDADITFVADDGARRGDGAPVLVAHTTYQRARQHLDDPTSVIEPVLRALRRVLGVTAAPDWTHAHRWTFAKPAGKHGDAPFLITDYGGSPLGICGDSWCPQGSPRVESAWLSGHRLGRELGGELTRRPPGHS